MKSIATSAATVLTIALLTAGCQQGTPPRDAQPADMVSRQVVHVVIVWLKNPGDAADRAKVVASAEDLRQIPGVVDVRAGAMLPSTRPVVDSSYDVAIVTTFKDRAALDAFGRHPVHQRVLNEVVQPLVERYRVYDFELPR